MTGVQTCALPISYNLTEPTQPVHGTITARDYVDAAGLLDRAAHAWGDADERLVLVDWYAGEVQKLEDPWTFQLNAFEDRFVLLCPIQSGWALIGRTDKYLSPAAVDVLDVSADEILLHSGEACEVQLWRDGRAHMVAATRGVTRVRASQLT